MTMLKKYLKFVSQGRELQVSRGNILEIISLNYETFSNTGGLDD